MTAFTRAVVAGVAASILVSGGAAAQQGSDGTTLGFFVWAPKVLQEVPGGTRIIVEREEILENLDMALTAQVIVERGPWMFGGDLMFADVSKSGTADFTVQDGTPEGVDVTGVTEFSSLTTVVNAFAGYKLLDRPDGQFWGTAGIRYANFEQDVEVETDTAAFEFGVTESATDFTVGLRGFARLNDQWRIPVVVDFGTGGSRFSFQVFGGASYTIGNSVITAGYRKIEWYLDDQGEFFERIEYKGPVVAYSYRF